MPTPEQEKQLDEIEKAAATGYGPWVPFEEADPEWFQPGGLYYEMRRELEHYKKLYYDFMKEKHGTKIARRLIEQSQVRTEESADKSQ